MTELRRFETERKASTDFALRPSSDKTLGPDPYVIVRLPEKARAPGGYVGLLRNSSQVVLLDDDLHELARANAPPLASGLTVSPSGEVIAGGEGSAVAVRYRVDGRSLVPLAPLDLSAGVVTRGIRALASNASGAVFAVDEVNDALVIAPSLAPRAPSSDAEPRGRAFVVDVPEAPIRVEATEHFVVVASLIGHALTVIPIDAQGRPSGTATNVEHDGPFWSIAAREVEGAVVVAAGGVEDHPLDRTEGSFAYVDPFVFLYRFEDGEALRLGAFDVGERGVVTPKALAWDGDRRLRVVGYGAPVGLDLVFSADETRPRYDLPPRQDTFVVEPGASSLALGPNGAMALADPLLDAFVLVNGKGSAVVPVDPGRTDTRSDASRLGEALFFTSALAPWQTANGALSVFTCETCHFEGTIDGRTHATGRGTVAATTKPLLGLFGNAPHFSRALDTSMARMVNAEFRVASANSGHDPWFTLDESKASIAGDQGAWLGGLLRAPDAIDGSPLGLRRAFMEFLMDATPRPNARALGRTGFDALEREGAEAFLDRCSSCHSPRLVADDEATEVPFSEWEAHVFGSATEAPGTIVWARSGYEKTGVEPYVHAEGARPTSLRRLAKKRPYFTNGSAKTLEEVLDGARFSSEGFWHDPENAEGDELDGLGEREEEALLAFLRVL